MPLFFWFDLFLEAKAEILEKISLVFLEDLKTPKGHFKINWPLSALYFIYWNTKLDTMGLGTLWKMSIPTWFQQIFSRNLVWLYDIEMPVAPLCYRDHPYSTSIIVDFFWPAHYVSISLVLNVNKTGHFLDPPPTQSFADVIYEWSQMKHLTNSRHTFDSVPAPT